MNKNYYEILGVSKTATKEEIKKAYRNLSKQYHPDKTGGDDTKFKEINEAYSVLSNDEKRREYDNPQQNMFGNGFSWNFNDSYVRRNPPADLRARLTIPIEEAYNGCERKLRFGTKVFNIKIPKGIKNNTTMRLKGMGKKGFDMSGREVAGDIIIIVSVANNDEFYLNDDGVLETMQAIDCFDAILGGRVIINVFGTEMSVPIPKYTQNGGSITVSGHGFPNYKADGYGDLKVNFIVKMPNTLSNEQEELLKQVREMKS